MGSVASVAKTNLLIIPIDWQIYADKLYLGIKCRCNKSPEQLSDINSKVPMKSGRMVVPMEEAVYSSPNRNLVKAKLSRLTLPHSAIPFFPLSVSL